MSFTAHLLLLHFMPLYWALRALLWFLASHLWRPGNINFFIFQTPCNSWISHQMLELKFLPFICHSCYFDWVHILPTTCFVVLVLHSCLTWSYKIIEKVVSNNYKIMVSCYFLVLIILVLFWAVNLDIFLSWRILEWLMFHFVGFGLLEDQVSDVMALIPITSLDTACFCAQ